MNEQTTYGEFEEYVTKHWPLSPEQREGQFWFNVLHSVKPLLANAIRGTMYDPFYDDRKLLNAQSFVMEHWDFYTPRNKETK